MCQGFVLKRAQIYCGGKARGQTCSGVQNLAAPVPSGKAALRLTEALWGGVPALPPALQEGEREMLCHCRVETMLNSAGRVPHLSSQGHSEPPPAAVASPSVCPLCSLISIS